MKVVYLASPFSAKSKRLEKLRYEMVTEVAAALQAKFQDIALILPITQSFNLKKYQPSLKGDFQSWKDIDLTFIEHSDEVWVVTMDGWKESIGVQAEIVHAEAIGKPVVLVDPDSLVMKGNKKRKGTVTNEK